MTGSVKPGERADPLGDRRAEQRGGRVERDRVDLGRAAVERLGDDQGPAARDDQPLGVEPAAGREPVIAGGR